MVQRKKQQVQHQPVVPEMFKNAKPKEATMETESVPEEGKTSPKRPGSSAEATSEVGGSVPSVDSSQLVEFEKDYPSKQLKLEDKPMPNNSYVIECVVEKLKGFISVLFFKNPGKDGLEPYLPIFRNVWGENVEEELLIFGIGNRCDSKHQFKRNKRNIADISAMQYGWSLFINESVKDPGDWAIHLCNCLNDSEPYKSSFDTQRTNGRKPHFEVVHVVDPPEEKRRKLDEVMMDDDIAKYLVRKFNLKSYGARRRLKTDEDWKQILHPFFVDVRRGQKVVLKYLSDMAGVGYST